MDQGKNDTYIDGLVSIIMPAYNAEKYIEEAIESVLEQTYQNWELIIINDCSTDNTLSLVKRKYAHEKRINIYTLEKNSGVASARNFGFGKAKGRYLAFLDSDDKWLPDKIMFQLNHMFKHRAYFVVSSYEIIDENSETLNKYFEPQNNISIKDQLKGSQIGCLTVLIDRSVTGEFVMPNIGHEDYVTWNNLIKKYGDALGINKITAQYRSAQGSLSANKLKAAKWQWRIYRDIERLNYGESIIYFFYYMRNGLFKYRRQR